MKTSFFQLLAVGTSLATANVHEAPTSRRHVRRAKEADPPRLKAKALVHKVPKKVDPLDPRNLDEHPRVTAAPTGMARSYTGDNGNSYGTMCGCHTPYVCTTECLPEQCLTIDEHGYYLMVDCCSDYYGNYYPCSWCGRCNNNGPDQDTCTDGKDQSGYPC